MPIVATINVVMMDGWKERGAILVEIDVHRASIYRLKIGLISGDYGFWGNGYLVH